MKRLFILISILFFLSQAEAQYVNGKIKYSLLDRDNTESKLYFEEDSIGFEFTPNGNHQYFLISISNKRKDKITVKWNDVVFVCRGQSSRVIDVDVIKLNIDNPIKDDVIYPKTSNSKGVMSKYIYEIQHPYVPIGLFIYNTLKKGVDEEGMLVIPIEKGMLVKEYVMRYKISYFDKKRQKN